MNTKAQHTPGPWMPCGQGTVSHPVSGTDITTEVIEAEGWGRIAEYFDYSNESQANFRLITAAPELLQALEQIVKIGGTTAETAIARAAIAKARGEA